MPSLKEVRENSEMRNKYVKINLMTKSPALLFVLAVDQFKEKPGKLRAIAIFDTFIKGGGLWKETLGEFDAKKDPTHAGVVNALKARIDWFRELRRGASEMNFFQRWRTSSNRAVAFAAEFDNFMNLAQLSSNSHSQLRGALTPPPPAGNPIAIDGWVPLAASAKKRLKGAGFDIPRLGLSEIPDVE